MRGSVWPSSGSFGWVEQPVENGENAFPSNVSQGELFRLFCTQLVRVLAVSGYEAGLLAYA